MSSKRIQTRAHAQKDKKGHTKNHVSMGTYAIMEWGAHLEEEKKVKIKTTCQWAHLPFLNWSCWRLVVGFIVMVEFVEWVLFGICMIIVELEFGKWIRFNRLKYWL